MSRLDALTDEAIDRLESHLKDAGATWALLARRAKAEGLNDDAKELTKLANESAGLIEMLNNTGSAGESE